MTNLINYKLWTVCMIQDEDKVLLLNRQHDDFKGDLLENSSEGKAVWVKIEDAYKLPMQQSIRRRFPLFFEEGSFEIQVEWNHEEDNEERVTIRNT